MMEVVGENGVARVPDKAEKAAGPWADDLRDWVVGLASGASSRGAARERPPLPAAGPSREAMLAAVRRSVMEEDWPMIVRSHQSAMRGDWKTIVALDNEWGPRLAGRGGMAEASMRAGQRQLGRMRPMRDARVVRRYIEAVDAGKASGWHPVVYGVLLAVHSIPLRQGMAHHALQVASALARSTGGQPGHDPGPSAAGFVAEVAASIPALLDPALKAGGMLTLQPCPA